jgi:hypothetical protein
MAVNKDALAKLGFEITTVDEVPAAASITKDSKYEKLFEAVPDTGALKVTYETNKFAQTKAGIMRGHLVRRKQSELYQVNTRANAVYITKK